VVALLPEPFIMFPKTNTGFTVTSFEGPSQRSQ
jgi:hypothetical protein